MTDPRIPERVSKAAAAMGSVNLTPVNARPYTAIDADFAFPLPIENLLRRFIQDTNHD